MSDERWTAPCAGWYRVWGPGEPEYLGAEPPEEVAAGTVVYFDEAAVVMNSGAGGALDRSAQAAPLLRVSWPH